MDDSPEPTGWRALFGSIRSVGIGGLVVIMSIMIIIKGVSANVIILITMLMLVGIILILVTRGTSSGP